MQIAVTIAGLWLFVEDKTFLKLLWTFLVPLRHSKFCSHPTELYMLKHSNQYFPTFRLLLQKMEWDGYIQEAIQLTSDLNCHFKGLHLSLDMRLDETIPGCLGVWFLLGLGGCLHWVLSLLFFGGGGVFCFCFFGVSLFFFFFFFYWLPAVWISTVTDETDIFTT